MIRIRAPHARRVVSAAALRLVGGLLATTALTGCGVLYTAPNVRSVDPAAAAEKGDVGVTVIELTPAAILEANAEPYLARALPAAFGAADGAEAGAPTAPRSIHLAALQAPLPPRLADPSAPPPRRLPPATPAVAYRVGAGDVLSLASSRPTEATDSWALARALATETYRVLPSGAVMVPEIGSVQVAGLTLDEIQAELLDQLARRRVDREVSVDIVGFDSQAVTLAGAVRTPMVAPITLSGLTLGRALAAAGGLVDVDPRLGVVLLQRGGETFSIPVADLQASRAVQETPLLDGDSLYVDRRYDLGQARAFFAEQIQLRQAYAAERQFELAEAQLAASARAEARAERSEARERFTQRLELGAEPRDYVYLAGEVGRQARVAMPYEGVLTLADVLFEERGYGKEADIAEIYVIRRPMAGDPNPSQLRAYRLDAGNAARLALTTAFEMRPSDVVFVESQPIADWSRVLRLALPFLTTTSTGLRVLSAIDDLGE